MTNEQLLRRLREKDQQALEILMRKYQRYVHTVIVNVLGRAGNSADVEELIADTFCSVWFHAESIRDLKAYLGSTARNRAIGRLRQQQELPMDLDTVEIPDPSPSMDERAAKRELSRKVKSAVESMRPKDREIFLRYYYYAQNTEEIAEIMGLRPATVRSRLARGREKLKTVLSKEVTP